MGYKMIAAVIKPGTIDYSVNNQIIRSVFGQWPDVADI